MINAHRVPISARCTRTGTPLIGAQERMAISARCTGTGTPLIGAQERMVVSARCTLDVRARVRR
jgi:exosome complex RNA-binding protein Csl4